MESENDLSQETDQNFMQKLTIDLRETGFTVIKKGLEFVPVSAKTDNVIVKAQMKILSSGLNQTKGYYGHREGLAKVLYDLK